MVFLFRIVMGPKYRSYCDFRNAYIYVKWKDLALK